MSTLRYIKGRIKNRRDNKDTLTTQNPLLYDGELCIEQDTNKLKCGDGITRYVDLPYIGGNLPTGSVIPFAGNVIPDDWLLCDGRNISRTEYAELFNVIGTKYGNGDGHSTFAIPDLNERIPWGTTDSSLLGRERESGLPNITGGLCLPTHTGRYVSAVYGAFKDSVWNNGQHGRQGADFPESNYWHDVVEGYFDASWSNPIYGSSDIVQPPSIVMYYIIKT